MYAAIGAHYPEMVLSQFNTSFDEEQSRYYTLLGGLDAQEWSDLMNTSIEEIQGSTANFSGYTAAGTFHTLLREETFYSLETEGVSFQDWFQDVLNGEVPDSVHCNDCGAPAE
jgi:hypothetical protein